MYRLIVETLLGVTLEVDHLRLTPRLPASWDGFKLHYRYRETFFHITIAKSADGVARITVDGQEQQTQSIQLVDDRRDHTVLAQIL
jgi:cellobiose phosphorylase